MSSVDKQAMVEDWLNPELAAAAAGGSGSADLAPQVQQKHSDSGHQCPCPGTSAQQKNFKVKYFDTWKLLGTFHELAQMLHPLQIQDVPK